MTAARWLQAGAVVTLLPLLPGCVAAAIPVLAAGGVLGTQVDGRGSARAERGPPRVSIDTATPPREQSVNAPATAAAVRTVTLDDGSRYEVMAGQRATAGAPAATPLSIAAPARAAAEPVKVEPAPLAKVDSSKTYTLDDGSQVRIAAVVPTPVPSGLAAASGPGLPPAGFTGYDGFRSYAMTQGTLPIAGSDRRSAMLASPGTLAPATRECSVHPAAVLIDLDPGKRTLDPAAAIHGDPQFAASLAALRAEGIAIGWISANTADRAGSVRRALVAAGLDPAGRDELALLRYPEERKQTRREDFAKEFCVVAIAGDDRGDFDELFQYLKNPSLAAPLEPLIGQGWFLIPQPLS